KPEKREILKYKNQKKIFFNNGEEKEKILSLQIFTLNLIKGLKLSKDQLQKIWEISCKAQKLHQRYKGEEQKLYGEMEKSFSEFKKEDELNLGFSKNVERKTATTNHKYKVFKKRFCQEMNLLEDQVLKLLSPQQKERLKEYHPHIIPRKYWSPKEELWAFLKMIHKMSERRWNHFQNRALPRILKRRQRFIKKRCNFSLDEWLLFLEYLRSLSEKELRKQKKGILSQVWKETKEERIRRELAEIHKRKYGSIGKVGKYLLHPYSAEIIQKLLKKGESQ
ncbi:MAG: hypothetical protein D6785_03395, partial [Planctomycetota bacterium]